MLKRILVAFVFVMALACYYSCSCNPRLAEKAYGLNGKDSFSVFKYSPNENRIIAGLDSIFKARVEETGFNGCVLVARRGKTLFKKAMGYAEYRTKKMLDLNSSFQLASASKPFTATAILMLMEQGKLKLDDDVKKYIPGFPYDHVTIKLLLSHRSGLPNYMYFAEDYFPDKDKPVSNADIVNCMIKNKPANYYTPDKKFEYCNTNYCLLAYIIEKISGKKFTDFMQENIFGPVGMTHTSILDRCSDSICEESTRGYVGSKWEDAEVNFLDGVVGDKNVYSSVYDLFLFDRALYSGKLLKDSTLQLAYTGYSNEHSGKRNYGLGWRIIDNGKGWKIVYHNGWWHGYNSLFFRRPIDQTFIVILCNHYNRSTYHIQDVLQVLDNACTDSELEKEE